MSRLACLPMYEYPETAAAEDALWRAIRERLAARGIEAPAGLTRGLSAEASWTRELFFGQACGYPMLTTHHGLLRVLATPLYDVRGCQGPEYRSFFIVGRDAPWRALGELRGNRFAVNSRHSNSGMNVARLAIAQLAGGKPFFSEIIESGRHLHSLTLVADGRADLAAIDCVTYAILARHRPALVARTRVLAETPTSRALPFVTGAGTDEGTAATLRWALLDAIEDPALASVRSALFLGGAVAADAADYAPMLGFETEARRAGYPELA